MKIHEYQGKQLFRDAGVPVLQGYVARTPQEAADAFTKLGGTINVVKAQIHAGGRGKGSIIDNPAQKGVVLAKSAEDAKKAAQGLLGNKLVTIQTGPEGQKVNQVFVEQGCKIARELYLGIVVDRAAAMPVLMVSSEGGVEIEKVAEVTDDGDSSSSPEPVSEPTETPDESPSSSARYRTQRRGGKGVRDIRTSARNGKVISIARVTDGDEIFLMTAKGKIQRIAAADINIIGRNTQGVRIMNVDEGDNLIAVVRVPPEETSETIETPTEQPVAP